MSVEQRLHQRIDLKASVVVRHPSFGEETFVIKDISDGGIAVKLSGRPFPPVGTILEVVIKKTAGLVFNPSRMRVVHHGTHSVGLQFI